MEWNDKDLDKLFREAYQSQSTPKNAAASWSQMQAMMNGSAGKKVGLAFWKKGLIGIAALLALVSVFAVFNFNPFNSKNDLSTTQNNEMVKPIPEVDNKDIGTLNTSDFEESNESSKEIKIEENPLNHSASFSSNNNDVRVKKDVINAKNNDFVYFSETKTSLNVKNVSKNLNNDLPNGSLIEPEDYAQNNKPKAKYNNNFSLYASGGWHLHNHWKGGQEFSLRNLPSFGLLIQKGIAPNVALVSGARYYYRGNMDYLVTSRAVSTYMQREYKDYHLRLKSGHWIEIPLNLQIQVSKRWMLESGPVAEVLIHHQSELEVHTMMPALDLVKQQNHSEGVANQYKHGLPILTLGWRTGVYGNLSPKMQLGTGFKYVPFVENTIADESVRNNSGWDLFFELRYRLF